MTELSKMQTLDKAATKEQSGSNSTLHSNTQLLSQTLNAGHGEGALVTCSIGATPPLIPPSNKIAGTISENSTCIVVLRISDLVPICHQQKVPIGMVALQALCDALSISRPILHLSLGDSMVDVSEYLRNAAVDMPLSEVRERFGNQYLTVTVNMNELDIAASPAHTMGSTFAINYRHIAEPVATFYRGEHQVHKALAKPTTTISASPPQTNAHGIAAANLPDYPPSVWAGGAPRSGLVTPEGLPAFADEEFIAGRFAIEGTDYLAFVFYASDLFEDPLATIKQALHSHFGAADAASHRAFISVPLVADRQCKDDPGAFYQFLCPEYWFDNKRYTIPTHGQHYNVGGPSPESIQASTYAKEQASWLLWEPEDKLARLVERHRQNGKLTIDEWELVAQIALDPQLLQDVAKKYEGSDSSPEDGWSLAHDLLGLSQNDPAPRKGQYNNLIKMALQQASLNEGMINIEDADAGSDFDIEVVGSQMQGGLGWLHLQLGEGDTKSKLQAIARRNPESEMTVSWYIVAPNGKVNLPQDRSVSSISFDAETLEGHLDPVEDEESRPYSPMYQSARWLQNGNHEIWCQITWKDLNQPRAVWGHVNFVKKTFLVRSLNEQKAKLWSERQSPLAAGNFAFQAATRERLALRQVTSDQQQELAHGMFGEDIDDHFRQAVQLGQTSPQLVAQSPYRIQTNALSWDLPTQARTAGPTMSMGGAPIRTQGSKNQAHATFSIVGPETTPSGKWYAYPGNQESSYPIVAAADVGLSDSEATLWELGTGATINFTPPTDGGQYLLICLPDCKEDDGTAGNQAPTFHFVNMPGVASKAAKRDAYLATYEQDFLDLESKLAEPYYGAREKLKPIDAIHVDNAGNGRSLGLYLGYLKEDPDKPGTYSNRSDKCVLVDLNPDGYRLTYGPYGSVKQCFDDYFNNCKYPTGQIGVADYHRLIGRETDKDEDLYWASVGRSNAEEAAARSGMASLAMVGLGIAAIFAAPVAVTGLFLGAALLGGASSAFGIYDNARGRVLNTSQFALDIAGLAASIAGVFAIAGHAMRESGKAAAKGIAARNMTIEGASDASYTALSLAKLNAFHRNALLADAIASGVEVLLLSSQCVQRCQEIAGQKDVSPSVKTYQIMTVLGEVLFTGGLYLAGVRSDAKDLAQVGQRTSAPTSARKSPDTETGHTETETTTPDKRENSEPVVEATPKPEPPTKVDAPIDDLDAPPLREKPEPENPDPGELLRERPVVASADEFHKAFGGYRVFSSMQPPAVIAAHAAAKLDGPDYIPIFVPLARGADLDAAVIASVQDILRKSNNTEMTFETADEALNELFLEYLTPPLILTSGPGAIEAVPKIWSLVDGKQRTACVSVDPNDPEALRQLRLDPDAKIKNDESLRDLWWKRNDMSSEQSSVGIERLLRNNFSAVDYIALDVYLRKGDDLDKAILDAVSRKLPDQEFDDASAALEEVYLEFLRPPTLVIHGPGALHHQPDLQTRFGTGRNKVIISTKDIETRTTQDLDLAVTDKQRREASQVVARRHAAIGDVIIGQKPHGLMKLSKIIRGDIAIFNRHHGAAGVSAYVDEIVSKVAGEGAQRHRVLSILVDELDEAGLDLNRNSLLETIRKEWGGKDFASDARETWIEFSGDAISDTLERTDRVGNAERANQVFDIFLKRRNMIASGYGVGQIDDYYRTIFPQMIAVSEIEQGNIARAIKLHRHLRTKVSHVCGEDMAKLFDQHIYEAILPHSRLGVELETKISDEMLNKFKTRDGTISEFILYRADPFNGGATGELPEFIVRHADGGDPRDVEWASLSPDEKRQLIQWACEFQDFDSSRLIAPLIVDDSVAPSLERTIEHGGPTGYGKIAEFHSSTKGPANETLQKSIAEVESMHGGGKAPNIHAHTPLPKFDTGDNLTAARFMLLYHQADMLLTMIAASRKRLRQIKKSADGGVRIFFDFNSAEKMQEIFLHLTTGSKIEGSTKTSAVGFRDDVPYKTGDFDDAQDGMETRILLDQGQFSEEFVNMLQRRTITSDFADSPTFRDMEAKGASTADFADIVSGMHYNQPIADLLGNAPEHVAPLLDAQRGSQTVRQFIEKTADQNYTLKMLVFDWSRDPTVAANPGALEQIQAAQVKALQALARDTQLSIKQGRDFAVDSGLIELYADALGMSPSQALDVVDALSEN